MCNLYSMKSNQEAVRSLLKYISDSTGNMPPLPGIFPDYQAPIARNNQGTRELAMARGTGVGFLGLSRLGRFQFFAYRVEIRITLSVSIAPLFPSALQRLRYEADENHRALASQARLPL